MKIKSIEYENFRNFKERGKIKFSTDGKVTIIYGKNGDGKTTLHQLFQWIIYGEINFNDTATDKLYNLQYEYEADYETIFDVWGEIFFEHDEDEYMLRRVYTYRKGLDDSVLIKQDVSLNKLDKNTYDWRRVNNVNDTMEKLLPSGLTEYFFFDGESMIADLRIKGKDSAYKLRKALYSMFNLDIMEKSIKHIGSKEHTSTVLGKLYMKKGEGGTDTEVESHIKNIKNAQDKKDADFKAKNELEDEKRQLNERIQQVSEQIGSLKSKAQYEKERNVYKTQSETYKEAVLQAQVEFGDALYNMFPQLLISKAVNDAKKKINLKVENAELPPGITKKLIRHLTSDMNEKCICGANLGKKEKEIIENYLKLMPPKSYASLYHDFSRTARNWGEKYDEEYLSAIIERMHQNEDLIAHCETQIYELDEREKKSPNIEDLVIAREKAESRIKNEIEPLISKCDQQLNKIEIYLKKERSLYDKATENNNIGQKVLLRMEIMQEVLNYFTKKLDDASLVYSRKLESNIQMLIDQMLTSKRKVSVSSEFSVRVTDNYNDESKSEGQFAVVSFAYIGGILKMLKSEEQFINKEYPLVLDGPFSKLDAEQRQNVVNMLPEFAPQVIIFSKDDLHDVFDEKNIGRVWTLQSNEAKNVASAKEGRLWK